MTDPKTLNSTISAGQSAIYARVLEEMIRAGKNELVEARQGLADVARVLCPDQVDFLTGKHPGTSAATLPLEELVTTMKGVAQTLRLIAANSTKSPGHQEDKLLARVLELEGLLRAEKRRADLFERSKANAEQTLESERTRAAKAARGRDQPGRGARYADSSPSAIQRTERSERSPATPSADPHLQTSVGIKDWETWGANFELQEPEEIKAQIKQLVEVVGKIGEPSLPEIVAGTGLDPERACRMVQHTVDRYGLLAEQETRSEPNVSGRSGQVYALSPKGSWFFKVLSGRAQVHSEEETLNKSPEIRRQGGLTSRVGARFEVLGWDVDFNPERIPIDEQTYHTPDLVIKKDSATLYVEIETGESIRTETVENWNTRFTNAYKASQGILCVVAETRNQMTTLLGKINFWLVQKKMVPILIYATTWIRLAEARPGESPWERTEQKAGLG
jgi:hypothetical protein